MEIRYIKIIMADIVAGLGLFFALQNVMNLDAAYNSFAYVMSMADHAVYANHFGPAITAPWLIWTALVIVVAAEFSVGLLASKGVWDMWKARKGSDATFTSAKHSAIVAAGGGVAIWFGLFGVVGSGYFQMWQTEVGGMSATGAFEYGVTCAVILIYLSMKEG